MEQQVQNAIVTNSTPKVSIIIPVYNVEKYIRKALDSVVNQTLKEIEIIIINDCTPDNSMSIIEQYAKKDNRFVILNQEINQGQGVARNRALDSATGEYIMFLDPDDWLELDACEKAYKQISTNKNEMVFFNFYSFNEAKNTYKTSKRLKEFENVKLNPNINLQEYDKPWLTACYTVLQIYSKDFLNKNNIRYTNERFTEDVPFFVKAIVNSKNISILDKPLYYYRQKKEGICFSYTNHYLDVLSAKDKAQEIICNSENKAHFMNIYLPYQINSDLHWLKDFCNKNPKIKKDFYKIIQNKFIDLNKNYNIKKIINTKNYNDFQLILECEDYETFKKRRLQKFIQKNILQKVFSIKNIYSKKKITALGVTFYTNRLKTLNGRIEYFNLSKTNIRNNSILMIEPNPWHGEVLAGLVNYFLDLNFNLDILITKEEHELNPFAKINNPKLRVFKVSPSCMYYALSNNRINKYKYLYINSDTTYRNEAHILNYFDDIKLPSEKILLMHHCLEAVNKELNYKPLAITDTLLNNQITNMVNVSYFDKIKLKSKNKITKFVVIGNIYGTCKNHNLLIDAVEKLVEQNITNFKITVIARKGSLKDLPQKIQNFIEFKQRLKYNEIFEEMEKADFFLPLLDVENPMHNRYITNGTSGSFQLIYGFRTPCIIANKFAEKHYFTDKNSLLYQENEDFAEQLVNAINMSNDEYINLVKELDITANTIKNKSFDNLKNILSSK